MNSISQHQKKGFTIVELIVVIVVLAILATIIAITYSFAQKDGMTTAGETAAKQVSLKSRGYYSVHSRYPTFNQLTTTTVAEAKLANPSALLLYVSGSGSGGAFNKATYSNGERIVYHWCNAKGGLIYYWDYTKDDTANPLNVKFGNGC